MLTNAEKETIIIFDEAEKLAHIETFNGRLIRRLTELSESREDCRKVSGPDEYGAVRFEFPAKWLKINAPREMSEAQKAVLAKAREVYRDKMGSDIENRFGGEGFEEETGARR